MQGTCLTSDTFIIPNLFPNRADFDVDHTTTASDPAPITAPLPAAPATPTQPLAPATLTIDSAPDLYHELSAISQEIEACRSAF